jgi:hypothetical protein
VILPESDSARGIRDVGIAGKEIMSNLFADRERSKKRHIDDSVKDRPVSQVWCRKQHSVSNRRIETPAVLLTAIRFSAPAYKSAYPNLSQ